MLIPILKARAAYHKSIQDIAKNQMKVSVPGSINYCVAAVNLATATACISELITIQQEISKLSFLDK